MLKPIAGVKARPLSSAVALTNRRTKIVIGINRLSAALDAEAMSIIKYDAPILYHVITWKELRFMQT